MLIQNIQISDKTLINFNDGLPGFEKYSQFNLANVKGYPYFKVLQSVDEPNVVLLLLEKECVEISKNIHVPRTALKKINVDYNDPDVGYYFILFYDKELSTLTANLRAPILINYNDALGYQTILDDENLSIHYPLNVFKAEK